MPREISKVLNIGPANITIGGVNVGHTDEEGAKIAMAGTVIEAMAGEFGEVGIRKWINGQRVTAEMNIIQTVDQWAMLEKVLPAATKVTNGADNKLTFGDRAGTELVAAELICTPLIAANTPLYDFTMYKAVRLGDWELIYSGAQHQKWAIKFEAVIDEAGGSAGNWLCCFGKAATTSDAVAPTVTLVSPVDGAPAHPVADNIVWTMSEEVDGNTVNINTVYVLEDPLGAGLGTQVPGAVSYVNNGASTTITFNPTGNLTGATPHVALLTSNVKDKNGNPVVGHVTNFTTA